MKAEALLRKGQAEDTKDIVNELRAARGASLIDALDTNFRL